MINIWLRIKGAFYPVQNLQRKGKKLADLEKVIGYKFKKTELLILSLTHRSYQLISGEKFSQTNERLEFLGDAVLGFLVTEYLFIRYPKNSEGILTEYKSIGNLNYMM